MPASTAVLPQLEASPRPVPAAKITIGLASSRGALVRQRRVGLSR